MTQNELRQGIRFCTSFCCCNIASGARVPFCVTQKQCAALTLNSVMCIHLPQRALNLAPTAALRLEIQDVVSGYSSLVMAE